MAFGTVGSITQGSPGITQAIAPKRVKPAEKGGAEVAVAKPAEEAAEVDSSPAEEAAEAQKGGKVNRYA